MILLYAGMQRVPRELHEAADLEGVSAWQRLRWLLVPQLAPVIALNLVLITIASFNTFDLIIPLTGGGPARRTEVISLFMYRLGFFDLEAGRAAAVAVVMLIVNLALAWVAGRLIMREATGAARRRAAPSRRSGRRMIATARRRAGVHGRDSRPPPAAFLLPQLWLFSLSLKSKAGIYEYPPRWFPADGSLANYRFALTQTQVPWYLWNSAIVAVLAAAATLAVAVPAAYVLSRERFHGRQPLMAALLAVQMVSPVILLVPIYGVIERLGLIDTRGGADAGVRARCRCPSRSGC